jgi:YidC/Oxa1 family membrane protein insertase
MFDFLAYPLGKFLKFIYDIAFENYGLAIIIFTFIVRLAMLPLTVKQHKSSMKMQEIQPLVDDIRRKYKDDREAMNQELMKLYQEHNYNPTGGCLPMLIQMPLLLTLYWVIIQPLKFMLGKPKEIIDAIVNAAAKAQAAINTTLQLESIPETVDEVLKVWGAHREIRALNFFNENPDLLSEAGGLLEKSELIDFRSFLGLHLGEVASFQPGVIFGPEWKTYLPLFLLVIVATAITFISSKLSMPQNTQQQGGASGCSTGGMMYIGPVMTLIYAFLLPAGVVLYWMIGYVFAIFQQLYINKFVLKKDKMEPVAAAAGNGRGKGQDVAKEESTEGNNGKIDGDKTTSAKQLPSGQKKKQGGSGSGKKGGKKKGGKKKK